MLAKQNAEEGISTEANTANNVNKSYSLFGEKHKSLHIDTRGVGVSVSEKVFSTSGTKFSDLNIHKWIVSNIEKMDFKTMTTVQEKALPTILSGKNTLVSEMLLFRHDFEFSKRILKMYYELFIHCKLGIKLLFENT